MNKTKEDTEREVIYYDKLVRDKIPEIIEASGKKFVIEIADDETYERKLEEKLQEELDEYLETKDIAELADLVEVVRALLTLRGMAYQELSELRQRKLEERGGFVGRVMLRIVCSEDGQET